MQVIFDCREMHHVFTQPIVKPFDFEEALDKWRHLYSFCFFINHIFFLL